jgi:hypothetical protein
MDLGDREGRREVRVEVATGLKICVGFYFVEGPICKWCKLQLAQSEPGRQPGFILSVIIIIIIPLQK